MDDTGLGLDPLVMARHRRRQISRRSLIAGLFAIIAVLAPFQAIATPLGEVLRTPDFPPLTPEPILNATPEEFLAELETVSPDIITSGSVLGKKTIVFQKIAQCLDRDQRGIADRYIITEMQAPVPSGYAVLCLASMPPDRRAQFRAPIRDLLSRPEVDSGNRGNAVNVLMCWAIRDDAYSKSLADRYQRIRLPELLLASLVVAQDAAFLHMIQALRDDPPLDLTREDYCRTLLSALNARISQADPAVPAGSQSEQLNNLALDVCFETLDVSDDLIANRYLFSVFASAGIIRHPPPARPELRAGLRERIEQTLNTDLPIHSRRLLEGILLQCDSGTSG